MWSWLGFSKKNLQDKQDPIETDMKEDTDVFNGLLLSDTFFPEEVLLNILVHVPWKDLLASRLVCKTWKRLIDYPLCIEKLDRFSTFTFKSSFSPCMIRSGMGRTHLKSDAIPFYVYYSISKGLFTKNLLKNPFGSGDEQHVCVSPTRSRSRRGRVKLCSSESCPRFKHWNVTDSGGDGWIVETTPVGSQPLPEQLEKRSCFVTSYHTCAKHQLIDLLKSGFSAKILDEVVPHIEVSEWYARRFDCGIKYSIKVTLLNEKKENVDTYEEKFEGLEGDDWYQVKHVFKDHGPGVRFVLFEHKGRDTQFWAGHYGSKMAGGSVVARIPLHLYQNLEDTP